MRFVDLLRSTVLLSAASATLLGVLTVAGAKSDSDTTLVVFAAVWWVVAGMTGVLLGRRAQVTPPIARALREARSITTLPELRPGLVLVNRLWPLIVSTIAAAALGVVFPQVAAVATGFGLIWSLGWRHQDAAVAAIEERDGATFYVERTSPVRPIQLVRAPGFRREVPTTTAGSAGGST